MLACGFGILIALSTVRATKENADFCDWPRIDGSKVTLEEFEASYYEKEPVVLTNLMGEWPAVKKSRWSQDQILQKYGKLTFNTSHIATNCRALWEFRNGVSLSEFLAAQSPASWFVSSHPMVRDMIDAKDFFRPDLLLFVGNEGPAISIGKRGQGNVFHDHQQNWLAQVVGQKRWFVIPPKSRPSPSQLSSRSDVGPCAARPSWKDLTGCVARPGEIVYVPSRWLHETCYLTEFSIGVAYVGNAVSNRIGKRMRDAQHAAIDGDLPALRATVAESTSTWDANTPTQLGATPLHLAASSGHTSTVRWLLSHGAKVNLARNGSKMDAACDAVEYGSLDTLKLLVENRATVHGFDMHKRTALHMAAVRGHVSVLEYLLDAVSSGEVKKFKSRDKNGMTPFQLAAGSGHADCVEFLLARRAGASDDREALHLAALNGHATAVEALLNHRADPHSHNSQGMQPAAAAARSQLGTARVFNALLVARTDLASSQNENGQAPMHIAAQSGHTVSIRNLLALRADIDPIAEGGVSPAHIAAFSGHADVMEFLAESSASLNGASDDGYRPIHAAVQGGHVNVVTALLKHRADVLAKGPGHAKPLTMAKAIGHKDITRLLSKHIKRRSEL